MIPFDGISLVLGLIAGAVASAAFFAGLALGMRFALRAANPVPILMLSAIVRMAALLGLGWLTATLGGMWAFAGFALAFMLTRLIVIRVTRAQTEAAK